ncbi:transcriptional regulator [Avibacterium volantium]
MKEQKYSAVELKRQAMELSRLAYQQAKKNAAKSPHTNTK